MPIRPTLPASLLWLLAGAAADAQWSSDPSSNLSVADGPGDQAQPKVRPAGDGGVYITWLDGGAGYDIRMQRLDAQGNELWGHNGILIFDRSVSSTQDYDLVVDADGNALVAYGDDGGVNAVLQVGINKVTPAGAKLFGPTGLRVTNLAAAANIPRIAALSDGSYAVGWTGSNNWGLQRVSNSGIVEWANPLITVELNGTGQALYVALCDLQPSTSGTVTALYIHGTSTSAITSTKHLYAQQYDASGAPQWNGGSPLIVFNTGSIANGTFPAMVRDGQGGVIPAWYDTAGARHAYIQHLSAAGIPRFAAPVPSTGATPGLIRTSASVAYDAAADAYYIASSQTNSTTQSVFAVIAQKIDSTGARLWGDGGVEARPTGSGQPSFVTCLLRSGGGCGVYNLELQTPTTHLVHGTGLDAAGAQVYANQPCTVVNTKGRLAGASTPAGVHALAWQDARVSGNGADVLAQNVLPDGSFGNPAPVCYANCDASTTPPTLNILDFNCFLNKFAAGDAWANCDASTTAPALNILDFTCFLNKFAAGCR
jgi:hypothetical protein